LYPRNYALLPALQAKRRQKKFGFVVVSFRPAYSKRRQQTMTQQQLLEEFASLPTEAQHQVADFVAFLRQMYKVAQPAAPARSTELVDEPFVGMWQDRADVSDSTAWVRESRKSEWGEGS
jgi:hypothetical protein